MTEPKLWSDPDTDATSFERTLLAAGRNRRMPDADRRAGFERLAASIQAGALQPAPAPAPAASTSPSLFATPLAKGVVVGAGVAALAAAGFLLPRARTAEPVPGPAAPTATAAARAASAVPSVANDPLPAASSTTTLPSPAAPGVSSAVSSGAAHGVAETRLREESLLVLDVRRTLREGDAASALARLTEAESKFPRGGLGQEREALMIEALFALDRTAVATRRAEAFLRAFPKSPHAERVRHLTKR